MGTNYITTRFCFTLIHLSLILSASARASEIDVLDENALGSVSQSQSTAVEMPPPSVSEGFLEEVRANSRRQAAEAAFNLSIIAAGRRDFTSAGTFIDEAIQLNSSNPDYLRVAAGVAYSTREYAKAEVYQVMVLEIARSVIGSNDLRVAVIMGELGDVYVAQKRYSEAESLLKQSLVIREQASGKMHPSLVESLNDLAGFAMQDGRVDDAEQFLKRVLYILEESVDKDQSDTAMAMHNLGDFYVNQKRFSEAKALYRRAVLIWGETPAKDRLELAAGLNELGSFYHSQKRRDEAKAQFELVMTLMSGDFGQEHPHVRTARSGLGKLKVDRERGGEVKGFSQKMFDELKAQLSERNKLN